jgi:hypothetical protein
MRALMDLLDKILWKISMAGMWLWLFSKKVRK